MKEVRFNEELNKLFGNDHQFVALIKAYPNRSAVEEILITTKKRAEAEAKGQKRKISKIKNRVARDVRKAVNRLLACNHATTNGDKLVDDDAGAQIMNEAGPDLSYEGDDIGYDSAKIVAFLKEAIDISTEDGAKELKMLEMHTASPASIDALIGYLRLWMDKIGVTKTTNDTWLDIWKLYYARRPSLATTGLPKFLAAPVIAAKIDNDKDYSVQTIKDYLLALCNGKEAENQRAYIEQETNTDEKLRTFVLKMLTLAGQCDVPSEDENSVATPTPVSVLLAAAAQILFFQVKQNSQPVSIPPALAQSARVTGVNNKPDIFEVADDEVTQFDRGDNGTFTESVPPQEFSAQHNTIASAKDSSSIGAPLSANLKVILGGGEATTVDVETDPTGVHSLGFAPLMPETDELTIEAGAGRSLASVEGHSGIRTAQALGFDSADASINLDELTRITAAPSKRVETTLTPEVVSASGTLTPAQVSTNPHQLPRVSARSTTRTSLQTTLAISAPLATVALTTVLAMLGANNSSRRVSFGEGERETITAAMPTKISPAPKPAATVSDLVPTIDHHVISPVVPPETPRAPLVFYSGPVLPLGKDTCIMGGAKYVLNRYFGIESERRRENLAAQAESAIRRARPRHLHTEPGDTVAMAYDASTTTWTVRQLRHDTTIAEATFVAPIAEERLSTTAQSRRSGFLAKLSTKVKGWWNSFTSFWA